MTLHFPWLHAPRWLTHAHFNRAVTLVLGIIGVSLLFGALRILDAAFSDTPDYPPAVLQPVGVLLPRVDRDDSAPVPADLVEVPAAAAEAISL